MSLDPEAVQGFVEGVRGAVVRPGDQGYGDARAIWNGLIDRRPALPASKLTAWSPQPTEAG